MEKLENITMHAETFLESLRLLDAESLNENEIKRIIALQEIINDQFTFILVSFSSSERNM